MHSHIVVDSTDRERMGHVKSELQKLLSNADVQNAVFLILANKQDLADAIKLCTNEGHLYSAPDGTIYLQAEHVIKTAVDMHTFHPLKFDLETRNQYTFGNPDGLLEICRVLCRIVKRCFK